MSILQVDDRNRIYHKVGGDVLTYQISDEATKVGLDTTMYFGYLSHGGPWVIMVWDTVAKTYRYLAGKDGYTAAWAARETNSYVTFDAIG